MEYQEFKEELLKELEKGFPKEQGYRISVQTQKEMGVLQIKKAGWEHTAELSCQNLHEIMPGFDERVDKLAEMIQETVHEVDQIMRLTDRIQEINLEDYDSIKNRLRVELVRLEHNGAFLSEGLYERQTFGALVPYVEIPADQGIEQTRISPDMLEKYGVSQRKLMNQAVENTKAKNPQFIAQFEVGRRGTFYYVVTADDNRRGATALMYPGVMEDLYQRIGKDYYVVPMNVREVLVIGKNEDITVEQLRTTLYESNRNRQPEDYLSSKVCEYNGAEKKLFVCKEEKSRKMERQ